MEPNQFVYISFSVGMFEVLRRTAHTLLLFQIVTKAYYMNVLSIDFHSTCYY